MRRSISRFDHERMSNTVFKVYISDPKQRLTISQLLEHNFLHPEIILSRIEKSLDNAVQQKIVTQNVANVIRKSIVN
jgi:putative heme degradation protein